MRETDCSTGYTEQRYQLRGPTTRTRGTTYPESTAAQNVQTPRIASPQIVGLTSRQRCISRGRAPGGSSSQARIAADTVTIKRWRSNINFERKPPVVPATRNTGTNYPESTHALLIFPAKLDEAVERVPVLDPFVSACWWAWSELCPGQNQVVSGA